MNMEFFSIYAGEIVLIVICLFLSALFAAAETAITSLTQLKAQHLKEQKGEKNHELDIWLHHPARVLTTILFANTVVNISASALATNVATAISGDNGVGIAAGLMTFLILVFGEIMPKAYARAHAERLALPALKLIKFIYYAVYPIIYYLSEIATRIIKRYGVKDGFRPAISQEELEFMFSMGEKQGGMEDIKKEMISGVFDLDETVVREVMTPRTDLVAVKKTEAFEEVVKLIIKSGHSRIPVYEESIDNIVGILFAKDVLRVLAQNPLEKPTPAKLMREPIFIPESKALMDAFKDLKRTKNHLAVVIDEYGGTAGIVTMEDALEEIVGDIQDEFDSEEAEVLKIDDETYMISGSMNIDDFRELFGVDDWTDSKEEEEEEDVVDTVGGWVTQQMGEIPEVGQKFTRGPLHIEVTKVSRHRIERLKVIKQVSLPEETSEEITVPT